MSGLGRAQETPLQGSEALSERHAGWGAGEARAHPNAPPTPPRRPTHSLTNCPPPPWHPSLPCRSFHSVDARNPTPFKWTLLRELHFHVFVVLVVKGETRAPPIAACAELGHRR